MVFSLLTNLNEKMSKATNQNVNSLQLYYLRIETYQILSGLI